MSTGRAKARLWWIVEWFVVSAALSWLFVWTWAATRWRGSGALTRSLRAATDGGV
jgi:hypothetical protein